MTFFEFILLYLLGQASNFPAFFMSMAMIAGFGAFVVFMYHGIHGYDIPKKLAASLVGLSVFMGFMAAATPKQETVALLLAGGLTLEVARSESVQSVAKNGLAVIDQELKKYLDTKPVTSK